MRSPSLLRFVAGALLASGLAALSHAQGVVVHAWDSSLGHDNGAQLEIPEKSGGPALRFRGGGALSVDADEGGRLVLVLDGKQTDAGRSARNLDPLPAAQVRIRFKPLSSGAPQQSIVNFGGCYELRFNRDRSKLEFITMYPDKTYKTVRVDVTPDIWNQALATFKDGKLTLVCGMSRAEESAPAVSSIATSFRIGLVGERPFTGSISEIVLSTP